MKKTSPCLWALDRCQHEWRRHKNQSVSVISSVMKWKVPTAKQ